MQDRIAYQGITFDDVLLEPGYSDVVPRDVDVRTQLTRNIRLNIPIVSARWTRSPRANWPSPWPRKAASASFTRTCRIAQQTREVDKVKRSENGIITDPITLPPDETSATPARSWRNTTSAACRSPSTAS